MSGDHADHAAQLDRITLLLYGIVAHQDELSTLARLATEEGIPRAKTIAKARTRRTRRKKRKVSQAG